MKTADKLDIIAPSANIEAFSDGENSLTVSFGEKEIMRFGRICAGGFQETLSLPEKLRRHSAHDGLSAELESINVIPFGCEYHVRRVWTIYDGIAMLNCDITADNGGRINSLELEPVVFPFTPEKIEFAVYGDATMRDVENISAGTLYCGKEPVIMLRAGDGEGNFVEFYAGDDFWRHRAAAHIAGADAEYTLSLDGNGLSLKRKVLIIPDDMTAEKRPWRFKSLIAWKKDGSSIAFNGNELKIDGCFAEAAPRRKLRNAVRKSNDDLMLCGKFPNICTNAAHLERSGSKELEHGDLTEIATDYLWANRELNKRGKKFAVKAENKFFGNSVALDNLASPLLPLED